MYKMLSRHSTELFKKWQPRLVHQRYSGLLLRNFSSGNDDRKAKDLRLSNEYNFVERFKCYLKLMFEYEDLKVDYESLFTKRVLPGDRRWAGFFLYTDLRHPLLEKYDFDIYEFAGGCKYAFLEVFKALQSREFIEFCSGSRTSSPADELLRETISSRIYTATRETFRDFETFQGIYQLGVPYLRDAAIDSVMVLGVKVGVVDYKDPEYIQKQLSNVMSLIEGDIHGQLVEIDFLQNHLKEKEDEKTDEEAESLKELNDLYEEIVVFATSELPECAKRIVDAAKDARDAEEDEEADDKEEEGDKAEGDDIMDFKTMASSQVYGFNQRLEEINKELGNPTMPSNYGNVTIINNFNVIGDFGGLRPPQNYGVEDPSWPDGAVIATVNVLFTVTEEHEVLKDSGSHTSNEEEEDEDRKRHSRLKTHPWTFEGCISGHVPLEWRVVSIS